MLFIQNYTCSLFFHSFCFFKEFPITVWFFVRGDYYEIVACFADSIQKHWKHGSFAKVHCIWTDNKIVSVFKAILYNIFKCHLDAVIVCVCFVQLFGKWIDSIDIAFAKHSWHFSAATAQIKNAPFDIPDGFGFSQEVFYSIFMWIYIIVAV